jgi:hypothetical protein
MSDTIPQPPTRFNLTPFAEQWFRWADIEWCFFPGRPREAERRNPVLARVRYGGGVYLMAWSKQQPATMHPADPAVQYIGETGEFRGRMNKFRFAAGFDGERYEGHSGGLRWPQGQKEHLWIAFFEVGRGLLPHLARGLRCWMEGVAQEEYRLVHGSLPPVNLVKNQVSFTPFPE